MGPFPYPQMTFEMNRRIDIFENELGNGRQQWKETAGDVNCVEFVHNAQPENFVDYQSFHLFEVQDLNLDVEIGFIGVT
jgi:hypothetical protein